MTRKQVMDAVAATEPGGTPLEFVTAVFKNLYPDTTLAWSDLAQRGWGVASRPLWSALWSGGNSECGFVSRVVVNDPTTFLSTDSQGRDRRIPVVGKTFYALPGGG